MLNQAGTENKDVSFSDYETQEIGGLRNCGLLKLFTQESIYDGNQTILTHGIRTGGPIKYEPWWQLRSKTKGNDTVFTSKIQHFFRNNESGILYDEPIPPKWPEKITRAVWEKTKQETEFNEVIGFTVCEKPITIAEYLAQSQQSGLTHMHRRFGVEQRSKIRCINPSMGCNMVSELKHKIPIGSTTAILKASLCGQDDFGNPSFVDFSRASSRSARIFHEEFDRWFSQFYFIPYPALDIIRIQNALNHYDNHFSHQSNCMPLDFLPQNTVFPSVERFRDELGKKRVKTENIKGASKISSKKANFRFGITFDISSAFNLVPISGDLICPHLQKCGLDPSLTYRDLNTFIAWDVDRSEYVVIRSRGSIFGNTHSICEWTRFSNCLAKCLESIFEVSCIDYVDDFCIVIRLVLDEDVSEEFKYNLMQCYMAKIRSYFEALRLPIAADKIKFGTSLEVLGLQFDFVNHTVRLTEDRKVAISSLIQVFIDRGIISPSQSDNLVGKLVFALSSIGGRAFLPLLDPLRRISCLPDKAIVIGNQLKSHLYYVKNIIQSDIRRRPVLANQDNTLLVYSDASFRNGKGALFICYFDDSGHLHGIWRNVHRSEICQNSAKYPINFLETVTGALAVHHVIDRLANRFCVLSVDNNTALAALLNRTGGNHYHVVSGFMWSEVIKSGGALWVSRVPTDCNIADVLTRHKKRILVQQYFPQLFSTITQGFPDDNLVSRLLLANIPSDLINDFTLDDAILGIDSSSNEDIGVPGFMAARRSRDDVSDDDVSNYNDDLVEEDLEFMNS